MDLSAKNTRGRKMGEKKRGEYAEERERKK